MEGPRCIWSIPSTLLTQELLDSCIAADRKAQAELYRKLYSPLMSVCRRYTVNELDARGLLNQAYLKILNGLSGRKPHVPFLPWCKRIVINTIISEFRKKQNSIPEVSTLDLEKENPASNAWNDIDHSMHEEELQRMLDNLPEATRNVFNLFAIDGFSHNEIASSLNISSGTSKWHVANARKLLQEQFAKSTSAKPTDS